MRPNEMEISLTPNHERPFVWRPSERYSLLELSKGTQDRETGTNFSDTQMVVGRPKIGPRDGLLFGPALRSGAETMLWQVVLPSSRQLQHRQALRMPQERLQCAQSTSTQMDIETEQVAQQQQLEPVSLSLFLDRLLLLRRFPVFIFIFCFHFHFHFYLHRANKLTIQRRRRRQSDGAQREIGHAQRPRVHRQSVSAGANCKQVSEGNWALLVGCWLLVVGREWASGDLGQINKMAKFALGIAPFLLRPPNAEWLLRNGELPQLRASKQFACNLANRQSRAMNSKRNFAASFCQQQAAGQFLSHRLPIFALFQQHSTRPDNEPNAREPMQNYSLLNGNHLAPVSIWILHLASCT